MHLLDARTITPEDDSAVDLGQSPGEIVLLSAADTELACLAAAQARRAEDAPSLRLANLLQLGHPMSVDLYVERVVRRARLVIVRLLGGRGYWPYGLEQLAGCCRERGILLAALPGDDQLDLELDGWSTVSPAAARRLWQYLVQGGIDNAAQLLAYAAHLLGRDEDWREPRPLLRSGLYVRPPSTGAHPLPSPPPSRGRGRSSGGGGSSSSTPRLSHTPSPLVGEGWGGGWGHTDASPDLDGLRATWAPGRPLAALVFYRALVQGGDTHIIDALIDGLAAAGLNVLPIFAASLKDPEAAPVVEELLAATSPDMILNATGFSVASPGNARTGPFAAVDAPVLQVVLAGGSEPAWRKGTRGLSARDLAMNVILPEVDGRVLSRAVAFKSRDRFDARTECHVTRFVPVPDRIAFVAAQAAAWARLRRTPASERLVALILANYPNRDGRIANGVGLDTPAATVNVLRALAEAGYRVDDVPTDGAQLISRLLEGVTNDLSARAERQVRATLPIEQYRRWLATLPEAVRGALCDRWGPPESDPHVRGDAFALAVLPLGHVVVAIQPARGYHVDPTATYHAPDLVPPHHYLAFHLWLREVFGAHAVVHVGKHGNLEWLPGKALALSETCFPEVALGPLPHLYPFIVNDPGEGSQAKRRTSAVIVDHLTPPLTRAESYGPLRELEQLVDEYYQAAGLDARRLEHLRGEILAAATHLGLDRDLGIAPESDDALAKLDNHLCELKELQIKDGLHVLGESPTGDQLTDLLVALVRVPRGPDDDSILRALARDLSLDFDPLAPDLAVPWTGPRPQVLATRSPDPWRTAGDTVERLELLARALVAGEITPAPDWTATQAVLRTVEAVARPAVESSGPAEIAALLRGLDGRFVASGPSGAPTRGRLDVLPTGRNFYSVDSRGVPTPAAWHLGWRSAAMLVERYLQEHGDWPRRVALSAWGTANMRTGGDDIAQALALLGVRPVWDAVAGRVTGIEVLPPDLLDRPRVDVTLRVSGFFRDAFPAQMALVDEAVRAVAELDEPADLNPIRARIEDDTRALVAEGLDAASARQRASLRVFGSKPGAYGAGLQALIDERIWDDETDLARAYVAWGGYAYGKGADGLQAPELLERRLAGIELILHNQDNREHDLLDSDDYYQFEGGLTAAVRVASGRQPEVYHNDHSRPDTPRIRTLREEIGRIVRGRCANPKWIRGVMRHGYKGAFEIAATVDYLFAFAATARVVDDRHFDALFDAYLGDEEVRRFLAEASPAALRETAARFEEAIARGLWRPSRNSAQPLLAELRGATQGS